MNKISIVQPKDLFSKIMNRDLEWTNKQRYDPRKYKTIPCWCCSDFPNFSWTPSSFSGSGSAMDERDENESDETV